MLGFVFRNSICRVFSERRRRKKVNTTRHHVIHKVQIWTPSQTLEEKRFRNSLAIKFSTVCFVELLNRYKRPKSSIRCNLRVLRFVKSFSCKKPTNLRALNLARFKEICKMPEDQWYLTKPLSRRL